jgi:hypothetical protein
MSPLLQKPQYFSFFFFGSVQGRQANEVGLLGGK